MRKTKRRELLPTNNITVNIEGLAALLSCGRDSARKIGTDARARIQIGSRTLYAVDRVREYLMWIAI